MHAIALGLSQTAEISSRGGALFLDTTQSDEHLFREMCDSTGGLLVATTRFQMHKELVQWTANLRDRYIVEFPRPNDSESGVHNIQISVANKERYLVHAAGVSMPLPDPGEANDANTVPVSKSPATFGKRKPLQPKY